MPLWLFTHTTFLFALDFVLFPYQICALTIHSCNTLFAHNFVPSPYQICSYDCTLIQLYICTQVCTFSLLSNLPLSQFTNTTFCLHSINLPLWLFTHTTLYLHKSVYLLPIKSAPFTMHSYNILFALNFLTSPYQMEI